MENVTSFSASLLSACAGDTNKSAEIANKAMIDMADNANKMGTDMGSIQNAYQGFAKQNYTMLDNLKLGYGGTKEEMDRLLKDAQAITGTKYDINNLADVYTAIGVIQDKLNITGTTAREAEQTFSGSFAMMKASVTNLLGNLSIGDGEAVARSMGELVESASTFFFGNFIPMLQTIFSNLPTAIGTAVEKVAPQIKENVLPLLTSIKDAIFTGLGNIGIDTGALQAIFDQLFNVKVDGGGIASMFSGLKDGIVQAINTILPIIPPIISAVQQIAPVVSIKSRITLNDGYQWSQVKPKAEETLEAYFLEMRKNWEKGNLVVRISQIENRLLNLDGILDVADTQLNDVASNLALAQEEIPLLGGVYIG